MKRCYIYIHRRLDTQEVFYVGRGTTKQRKSTLTTPNTYKRAYEVHNTKQWKNLTNSTPWKVEILHDFLTWEESIELEKKHIREYGRRDLGLGTLINFTDGGEGTLGWIMPEYIKKQKRERWSGDNNPNKKLENKVKQSKRMTGDSNPMKNKETALKVAAIKAEAWANGRPHPLKGKSREDVRQNNLLNNPAKRPEVREKIRQARLKYNYKGGNSPVAKRVLHIETGIEYGSIGECTIATGISSYKIHQGIYKGLFKIF
jgi:hypothetical protein